MIFHRAQHIHGSKLYMSNSKMAFKILSAAHHKEQNKQCSASLLQRILVHPISMNVNARNIHGWRKPTASQEFLLKALKNETGDRIPHGSLFHYYY